MAGEVLPVARLGDAQPEVMTLALRNPTPTPTKPNLEDEQLEVSDTHPAAPPHRDLRAC